MDLIKDSLTSACRGGGKYIMLVCVVLSSGAKLAGGAPLVGPIAGLLLASDFRAIYRQRCEELGWV